MKRRIPLALTFLFGSFVVLSNFIVWEKWRIAAESVNNWALIVIAFTTVLGVGNVLRLHGVKISRKEPGFAYSIVTLLGLSVMVLFGIGMWFLPQTSGETLVRFRALSEIALHEAVSVGVPQGSGDLFDVRVEPVLAKDANGDGSAGEGDEIEYRIAYGYSGAGGIPAAVLSIRFDPVALAPIGIPTLGGTAGARLDPPVTGARGAGESSTDGAAGQEGPVTLAGTGPQFTASQHGLDWNVGRIEGSAFGAMLAGNGQASLYTWFYDAVYTPMQSTMYALLAFFISSAAFRAFRVRSTHAVLLGVTAIVVILGSVPVGEAVWGRFPELVSWVMNDLQTAGKRAILIGAALGAIATGMKMILGAERSYLSAD